MILTHSKTIAFPKKPHIGSFSRKRKTKQKKQKQEQEQRNRANSKLHGRANFALPFSSSSSQFFGKEIVLFDKNTITMKQQKRMSAFTHYIRPNIIYLQHLEFMVYLYSLHEFCKGSLVVILQFVG